MEKPSIFSHGHATLIGVGGDLPVTIKDAEGLHQVLTDPNRCAYPEDHVRLLKGEAATRERILVALEEMAISCDTDPEATAILFYSGHGGFRLSDHTYFLVPSGYNWNDFDNTAITETELIRAIQGIKARRLLVLLDCCHAGGFTGVKSFSYKSPPPSLIEGLSLGEGRAVVASSKPEEVSLPGDAHSVFTGALLEGLAGKASFSKTYVELFDVLNWLGDQVPKRTGGKQTPVFSANALALPPFHLALNRGVQGPPELEEPALPPVTKKNGDEPEQPDDPKLGSCEVCVLYNDEDGSLARRIGQHLKSQELRVCYENGKRTVEIHTPQLDVIIGKARCLIILIGRTGFGPWHISEMEQILEEFVRRGKPVIPVLLEKSPSRPDLGGALSIITWLELRGRVDDEAMNRLRVCILGELARQQVIAEKLANTLEQILLKTKRELIIAGHTLDRFSKSNRVRTVIMDLLGRGIKITVVQLNPMSKAAEAHLNYHKLESRSAAPEQHEQTVEFFRMVFHGIDETHKQNLQVIFTNYMPRFRCIVVDDCVYIYFYMYGTDVSDTPDLVLTGKNDLEHESLRQRVLQSIKKMIEAPESIPFICYGRIFDYWKKSKIASWDNWGPEERLRHRIIHTFYVQYARPFHGRFGLDLEREVILHLDALNQGSALVLGCGSGKEVANLHMKNPNRDIVGIDFSPVAIELAKQNHPVLKDHFTVGDFYDLDFLFGEEFDSIVANAAFVHLFRRKDIDVILKKVWKRLSPNGTFFLRNLYKEGPGGAMIPEEMDRSRDRGWVADRWFVYYSREELGKRCAQAGFQVVSGVTERIARELHLDPSVVLKKGFPHSQYERVYWPTLLLRKPGNP